MTDPDVRCWLERARTHRASLADARVSALFETCELDPAPSITHRWRASDCDVCAYELTVDATAAAIAVIERAPAVRDAVTAVLSAAVSADRGCSLSGLRFRWRRVAQQAHGYRELPSRELAMDREDELRREVAAFLGAMGEDAQSLAGARVRYDGSALVIEGARREDVRRLTAALTALAGTVRVVAAR